jgi:hypothetical protein
MNKLLACLAAAVLGCWPSAPAHAANGSVAAAMARRTSVAPSPPCVPTTAAAPQQNETKATSMRSTAADHPRSRA